jgi:hypothetical protein
MKPEGRSQMNEISNETTNLAPSDASDIVRETRERARQELQLNRPLLFAVWGLTALVGYGILWLSVRHQHPYRGPSGAALAWLLLVVVIGIFLRIWVVSRSSAGLAGPTNLRRGILSLSLVAGTATLWIIDGALSHAGAPRAATTVLEVAAPLLSLGLVFCASAAARSNVRTLFLGLGLLIVVAIGAWAGPVGCLAVFALAGGGVLLVFATVETLV